MISVQNLEKRYGAIQAVADVSFEVEQGEIVGLLGHNGAGKTTIMKIMTGFLEPTGGSVTVGGHDVVAERLAVQEQIGYLPESAPLYPEMLVQEYLLMMADLRGIPGDERLARVSEAVRATGLQDRLTQPIGTLSKGFRQRVGIAQAILHKPKVLVLDEPTNGLDPVQILEIRELIRNLAKNTTIILSTHIMQEIEAVCDRVIVLINGHLEADTNLQEMLRSNVVRLALSEDTKGVDDALGKLEGVEGVDHAPCEDHGTRYRIHCKAGGDLPTEAILDLARDKGWKIRELAPERASLENVFRDLMAEHVERARMKEVA